MKPSLDATDDPWSQFAALTASPPPFAATRVRARLSEHLRDAERAKARRPWWIASAACCLALAAVVLLVLRAPGSSEPTEAPTPVIATAPPTTPASAPDLTAADAARELPLPHGGSLLLAPGSAARVQTSDEGARIILRHGTVTLDVHAGPGRRWRVETGEYLVEALGTVFAVEATDGRPVVHVSEGRVRITGPTLPAEGEVVESAKVELTDDAPARTIDAEPAPVRPRRRTPTAWTETFRAALRRGETRDAAAALPKSFPTGREAFSASDYLDAGDVLRGQGRDETADAAYAFACQRKPSSRACGAATVRRALLAAADGRRNDALALASEYLSHWPKGALASTVYGKRMKWLSALGRDTEARGVARDYLARWPKGSQAALARSILAP
ncbi:MAG: FecR domain-containing protein [Myxococcota bacterium]